MTPNKHPIQPVPGYLLIEPQASEEKTASGIILPKKDNEDQQVGTILVSGGEYTTDHGTKIVPPAKEGDKVIFKEWGKQKYKHHDHEYYLVKYDDVVAIITN